MGSGVSRDEQPVTGSRLATGSQAPRVPGEDQRAPQSIFRPSRHFHKRAPLIVGEGLDGSGKTTVMNGIADCLAGQKIDAIVSNWNDVSDIYNLTMSLNLSGDLTRNMRLVLGAAELAARYHYVIRPALDAGTIVLANKYVVSAMAHALLRGVRRRLAERAYSFAYEPDLLLYFDVPPEVALERKLRSGHVGFWEAGLDMAVDAPLDVALRRYRDGEFSLDFLSAQFIDFQGKLRYAHEGVLRHYRRVVRVDATRPYADVLTEAILAVEQLPHIPAA